MLRQCQQNCDGTQHFNFFNFLHQSFLTQLHFVGHFSNLRSRHRVPNDAIVAPIQEPLRPQTDTEFSASSDRAFDSNI